MKQYEVAIEKIRKMSDEDLKEFLKNFCPIDFGFHHVKCPDIGYSCDWCWRKEEREDVD